MRRALGLVAFVVAALLATTIAAQEKSVSFITGNDYKPYTDEGLPGGGLITEVMRQVFEERGYDFEVEFLDTWPPVYDAAAASKICRDLSLLLSRSACAGLCLFRSDICRNAMGVRSQGCV